MQLSPDACLRLGPPWPNQDVTLALTVCEVRPIFFVSLQYVNWI